MKIICHLVLALLLVLTTASPARAQWIQTNSIRNVIVYAFAKHGGYYFAGGAFGVYRSADHGSNWVQLGEGLADSLVRSLVSNGRTLFAGTPHGVFRSVDLGATWAAVSNGIPQRVVFGLAAEGDLVYASFDYLGLYRSRDQGASWSRVGASGSYRIPSNIVSAVTASPAGLFAGTNYGGLYRSVDHGDTWLYVGIPQVTGSVSRIAARGWTLLACADRDSRARIFRSTDLGASWQLSDSGVSSPGVSSFACTANTFFAATYDGFYVSTDDGRHWVEKSEGIVDLNHGMTNKTLYALLLDDRTLSLGGGMKGVWQRLVDDIVPGEAEIIPSSSRLAQNYPNPFNSKTVIQYTVAGAWGQGAAGRYDVRLTIHDLLGRELATLVNEPKDPGIYQVGFEGTGLASGVYFYRLQAGSFAEVKRLMLLR